MYTGLLRGMWFQSHVAHYKAVISLVDRTLDFQSRDKSLNLLWSLAYIMAKIILFHSILPSFKRGSICASNGTVRFRRARNRLTLRPACKVATDHRVYVWAHGTAKVYKYENAVVRGIK